MNMGELIRERQAIHARRAEYQKAEDKRRAEEDLTLDKINKVENLFRAGMDVTRIVRARELINIHVKDSYLKKHWGSLDAVFSQLVEKSVFTAKDTKGLIAKDWRDADYHRAAITPWHPGGQGEDCYFHVSLKPHCRSMAKGEGRIPNEMLDPIIYYLMNYMKIAKLEAGNA